MKSLYNTILIAIVCAILLSCRTFKQVSTAKEVNKKDSISYTHIQYIDTIRIPSQKMDGAIPIEILKQLGSYQISNNGLTTKVFYIHDTIKLETTKDSSMVFVMRELIKEFNQSNHSSLEKINKNKVVTKSPIAWKILFYVLLAAVVGYYVLGPIIYKFLK